MRNLKLSILFASIVGWAIYLSTNGKNLKQYFPNSILSRNQIIFFKKYILPYRTIDQQAKENAKLNEKINKNSIYLSELELLKKNSNTDIITIRRSYDLPQTNLFDLNNITLEKYRLTSGFYSGISNNFPGSGYIDFYKDDMIIVSSKGVLAIAKISLQMK